MTYYKIYCDEGIRGQYAGTLKPSGAVWSVRFRAGFEKYFGSGFDGLFEDCCAYISRYMQGHLTRVVTDPEEDQIRKAAVEENIKKLMVLEQKTAKS
jgi:hypothetical protein